MSRLQDVASTRCWSAAPSGRIIPITIPPRLVIALHKKAPVTASRPGAFIKRSVSCHSPRPLFPLPR